MADVEFKSPPSAPPELTAAPVLSTPESQLFEDPTPAHRPDHEERLTDEELWKVFEVGRTAGEVVDGGWRRVALQFPDGMLGDATRVFGLLEKEIARLVTLRAQSLSPPPNGILNNESEVEAERRDASVNEISIAPGHNGVEGVPKDRVRLYILADTSYGSCCVDEVAAEHVDADVVVHYGRSCLSPTARLPVIYVFTQRLLDVEDIVSNFKSTFPDLDTKVVLMADISYTTPISAMKQRLKEDGYSNLVVPEVIHDPSSEIPNRQVPADISLKEYALFHISDPPDALLLTLSSRVQELFIYPTTSNDANDTKSSHTSVVAANTSAKLRRRYALITRLSTCPIYGILINTLSVRNYLSTVSTIRDLIAAAGKKSYTFVVGKVNAAKIANFSEIGGWVVIGCWESSLIESREFYRPIITPFELGIVLMGDGKRVWDWSWRGDFEGVVSELKAEHDSIQDTSTKDDNDAEDRADPVEDSRDDNDSEEESEPPEFDLRTGRYVSHSRPMALSHATASNSPISSHLTSSSGFAASSEPSKVLTRRAKGDLATVNGHVSPGAEYLRTQRTWTGLGSDFKEDASTDVEEGRSGVARGYTIGEGGRT